jgi:hypothetical protein
MTTLSQYQASVETLEQGGYSTSFQNVIAASKSLTHEICLSPWTTPADRCHAQQLLGRLEKLNHPAQGQQGNPA